MGGVILGTDFDAEIREQLTDSKKLSAKKREALNAVILEQAAATGLGWVSAAEIDRYGLGPSLKLAARRAVKQILDICKEKTLKFDEIVIDGTINLLSDTPLADQVTLLPKADFLIKEVSAASIIAKVARDRYMTELTQKYPGYSFEKHVGYGTAAHQEALRKLGPCPEHRQSFRPIQKLIELGTFSQRNITTKTSKPTPTTTDIGRTAEGIVANHLRSLGHEILDQNFKTKTYEIDIISKTENKIYFTEVKYRKNSDHGSSLAQITPQKQTQMRYAAELFLADHPAFATYEAYLAAGSVSGSEFRFDDWLILEP